jgi:very-short-patch-repair endonuclease
VATEITETFADGAFFRERVEVAARMARFTESPIEVMFGMAMMEILEDDWNLIPQWKFGRWRVDWALELPLGKPILIECDGSEFHTSREAVTRDRLRDQLLRRQGYRILRFTGRQIYRDAAGCARKVWLEAKR